MAPTAAPTAKVAPASRHSPSLPLSAFVQPRATTQGRTRRDTTRHDKASVTRVARYSVHSILSLTDPINAFLATAAHHTHKLMPALGRPSLETTLYVIVLASLHRYRLGSACRLPSLPRPSPALHTRATRETFRAGPASSRTRRRRPSASMHPPSILQRRLDASPAPPLPLVCFTRASGRNIKEMCMTLGLNPRMTCRTGKLTNAIDTVLCCP